MKYESFYATAATVMPVIFFFLLIEVRWFTPPMIPTPKSARAQRALAAIDRLARLTVSLLVLQIGYVEYACMAALVNRQDNLETRNLAMVNIVALSSGMVAAALPFVWRRSHGWSWELDAPEAEGSLDNLH